MNSKLRDILNNFRRQTIVIDNNNSLGGGERGAEAFESSIDAAEKAINRYAAEREREARIDELEAFTDKRITRVFTLQNYAEKRIATLRKELDGGQE